MSVVVPNEIVEQTRIDSEGRGSKRLELLMQYVTPLLEEGERVIGWERDQGNQLVALTASD